MCALAHMLEERGFSTVAIASVRAQAEKTRPTRALWTTSQLGRPLGEPSDALFQRRVLLAALGLLERTDGPVIIIHVSEHIDRRFCGIRCCHHLRPEHPAGCDTSGG